MTAAMVVSLVLTALGALGSGPVLVALWRWWRWDGIILKGKWKCRWRDEQKVWHENETTVKQRGPKVTLIADNEWRDRFEGQIDGNFIKGTWRSRSTGTANSGVFMLKIKGKTPGELEGCFVGLDGEGKRCVTWPGTLTQVKHPQS